MAYTSCAAEIAANIAQNCATPNVGGYTGRFVLISRSLNPTITKSGTNPRIVAAITLQSGEKTVAGDNAMPTDPLTGSTTELSTDNGWGTYNKSVAIRVPERGAGVSKEVVEPLANSPLGVLGIFEKRSTKGDGSFEIIGLEKGMKASAITRDEYAADGDWQVTLSTAERYAEYTFFDTDYATTLTKFEALLALSY